LIPGRGTNRQPAGVRSTWAALADVRLDWPRARALAAELGRPADGSDPEVVAAVEAAVLPRGAGLSVRGLREAVRRESWPATPPRPSGPRTWPCGRYPTGWPS
jgi:hypothetical protein